MKRADFTLWTSLVGVLQCTQFRFWDYGYKAQPVKTVFKKTCESFAFLLEVFPGLEENKSIYTASPIMNYDMKR